MRSAVATKSLLASSRCALATGSEPTGIFYEAKELMDWFVFIELIDLMVCKDYIDYIDLMEPSHFYGALIEMFVGK